MTSPRETAAAARRQARSSTQAERVLGEADATLLDIVDNVLSKGVVLTGDLTLGLAQVDLVYARVSLLLCAADRIMPGETGDALERRTARRAQAAGRRGAPRRG